MALLNRNELKDLGRLAIGVFTIAMALIFGSVVALYLIFKLSKLIKFLSAISG